MSKKTAIKSKIKGELLLKALEIVEKFTYGTADFMEAFLSSSKSDYRALRNFQPKEHQTIAGKIREELEKEEIIRQQKLQEMKMINNLIYRLKRDGLIQKIKKNNKEFWKLTADGKRKKERIEKSTTLQLPHNHYKAEPSAELIIFSYDIPQREAYKRFWLRAVLKNLRFKTLQKSVWVGKIKIPQLLINDLKRLHLFGCVEIFAVSKKGTIKHIT